MPVLGHGFVGVATALLTRKRVGSPRVRTLWVPLVVLLAYAPDLAAQGGKMLGFSGAGERTHSIAFAVAVSVVATPVLARTARLRPGFAFGLSLLTVSLHTALDVLQATPRMLLWPVSLHTDWLAQPLIPEDPVTEGVLFGAAFGVFLGVWVWVRTRTRRDADEPVTTALRRTRRVGYLITASIFLAAFGLSELRVRRTQQLDRAWAAIRAGNYDAGLAAAARAARWPGYGKPGRIDYCRAEAHALRGDRKAAERYYLRALDADPSYFWVVADLAAFYASSDEPAAVRRKRTAPFLHRLQTDFARHEQTPKVLSRVQRKLARP